MVARQLSRLLDGLALAGMLFLIAGTSIGQESRVVHVVAANPYWLGIIAIPLDEAMKSQLNLDERLIVQNIMPESPAAKAGVKVHDILLAFGGTEIHRMDDLTKAVRENGDKEAAVTILRGGKKDTVRVKPEQRPAGSQWIDIGIGPEAKKYEGLMRQWLGRDLSFPLPDGSMRMQFFGPGFIDDLKAKFPDNLSISITKQGGEPAKIVVKRGDDQWEVTDETLDKLPEDVRSHVEGFLGRRHLSIWTIPHDGKQLQLHLDTRRVKPEEAAPGKRPRAEARDPVGEIRRQLEELRKEVDKLKQGSAKEDAAKKNGV